MTARLGEEDPVRAPQEPTLTGAGGGGGEVKPTQRAFASSMFGYLLSSEGGRAESFTDTKTRPRKNSCRGSGLRRSGKEQVHGRPCGVGSM